jgi:hypothetical protein
MYFLPVEMSMPVPEDDQDLPISPPIPRQPWETPRVVDSAIKDHTAYTGGDDKPPIIKIS